MDAEPGSAHAARMPPSPQLAQPPDSLTVFFLQNYRLLTRHVMYLGATLHEAEEAAQEAMAQMVQRWDQVDSKLAYAKRAAINTFLKSRTRGLERTRARQVAAGGAVAEAQADGSLSLWEDRSWVMQLLNALPPRQREVMAFIVDDFKPAEVAELLGRTPSAVRNTLRSARERLERDLARQQASDRTADTGSSSR